ncbi:MAG: glycosyltransferase [Thermotoga sp.]|nr:MAG: glycosyltransferase [Thermotoga sp.]
MRIEKLFGMDVFSGRSDELMNWLERRLKERKKTFIVTLNTYMCEYAIENEEFLKIVKNADVVVPDGEGIVLALRILKGVRMEKIAGIDLMVELIRLASKRGYRIFLLGSKRHVVEEVKRKLEERFGNLIVGSNDGYFKEDEDVIESINRSNADILFVGMGSPKQELWMAKNMEKLEPIILMGVGGSFDVLSGYRKRAPKLFIRLKLEWLFRMLQDPRKLSRLGMMVRFVFRVLKRKLMNS